MTEQKNRFTFIELGHLLDLNPITIRSRALKLFPDMIKPEKRRGGGRGQIFLTLEQADAVKNFRARKV